MSEKALVQADADRWLLLRNKGGNRTPEEEEEFGVLHRQITNTEGKSVRPADIAAMKVYDRQLEAFRREVRDEAQKLGIKGTDWHPLRVLEIGLFNLTVTLKLALTEHYDAEAAAKEGEKS